MTQFTNGYALLIGVDEHEVAKFALPDVKKDIEALQGVLVDSARCAYPAENVKVILGRDATKSGIIDVLDWLDDQLKKAGNANITAVIYYSGHGWVDEELTYYLIPYDVSQKRLKTRSLKAVEFVAEINALNPRRLLVMLDCCFAGGMGVKSLDSAIALPPELFAETEGEIPRSSKSIEGLERGRGRAVLSSSTGTQRSYMRKDGKMSVFTYHLIEALTGKANYQKGATEVLVSDVMSYIDTVQATTENDWGEMQTPTYYVTGNFAIASLLGGKGIGAKLETGPIQPKPEGGVFDIRKEALEKYLADLVEEYEAAYTQLSSTIGAVSRIHLQRQIKHLESKMAKVEEQLDALN